MAALKRKGRIALPAVLALTAGWVIPASATDGDLFAKGTKYYTLTYPNHPHVCGTPIDINIAGTKGSEDEETPLYAPENGTITKALKYSEPNGWGNNIYWTSSSGEKLFLAHLKQIDKTGSVKAGEKIGELGKTGGPWGAWGWNAHLHIERCNGQLQLSGTKIKAGNTYTSKGPVAGGPGGPEPVDPSDPPASGKLPDFITDKVILAKENGKGERYTWKVNETAWVHAWVDNIGTANWEGKKDKIKVSFYLSKGTKKDSSSEWVRVGREEIKKKNVEVKDKPKHEKIAFNIPQWAAAGYIYPGRTYNFVVCADRPKDQDNGDGDVKEIHKSNNCSTEAVFYVDYVEPPEKSDLTAHSLQLNSGSTTLTGGSLYGMTVNMSNAGAGSADIGFQIKYEIKGPSTGGQWQTVGEKSFTAVPFAAGADQQISTNDSFAAAPTIEGDYLLRACADSKQAVAESNEGNNCSEALEVYVSPASEFLAKPVYRFWSSEQSSHFYTISEAEKDRVIAIYTPYQWQYERVEGCALPSQEDDSLPVYRFYSSPLTLHRFTISEEEKDSLMAMSETFKYEGIAWYAYTYQKEGTVPVYRFYSEAYKSYFYTVSEAERDLVLEKYPDEIWRYDGIAWYIFECP